MHKNKEPYLSLYKILGFYPDDLSIYKLAFVHKSSIHKMNYEEGYNNERLEFLGDAILEAAVTDYLYKNCEGKREGFLSEVRSKIVQRTALDRVAAEFGIEKLMIYSKRQSRGRKHIFGNALEALIGAVYLDQGYDVCYRFITNEILHKHIDLQKLAREGMNPKTRLFELGRKHGILFEFELLDYSGNVRGSSFFYSVVVSCGKQIGGGSGGTKKESEVNAARNVLEKIQKDKTFLDEIIEWSKQMGYNYDDPTFETPYEPSDDPE